MNISEILNFKYPNEIKNGQIVLQDDGQGPYIKTWRMGSIPKPTNEEILAWQTDATVTENKALYNRVNAADGYGKIEDQLDMIYKDLRDGTQLWQQKIGNIKDVLYPKTGIATTPPNVTPIVTTKRNSPSASYKEILIATSNATQAIAGTNKVTVSFNTEVSDPNNAFNSNIYTALTGGIYEINGMVQFTNAAIANLNLSYNWQLYVTKGTTYTLLDSYTHGILAALPGSMRGIAMIPLVAGDTITLQVQKTVSTSLNIVAAYFAVKKISEI